MKIRIITLEGTKHWSTTTTITRGVKGSCISLLLLLLLLFSLLLLLLLLVLSPLALKFSPSPPSTPPSWIQLLNKFAAVTDDRCG